jgi:large subunit ribosomal protein L6e
VTLKKGKTAAKPAAAKAAKVFFFFFFFFFSHFFDQAEPKKVSVYRENVAAPSRRSVQHPTKTRASLVPGTVLILLAGKFRGKRVVLVAVLPSGLLLVSGPYKLNGVPLRRVNAAFVIATSTRVDFAGVKLKPELLVDSYYTAPKTVKPKRTGKEDAAVFAAAKGKKSPLAPERASAQKDVDGQLLAAIKKTDLLAAYLRKPFTLTKGQAPHLIKF